MTETDELRRMLTEAGVEWDYGITGAASTRFNTNGVELTFIDMRDGVTCSTILTPEQAIAATLGKEVTGETSDGYHTFNELYHHRAVLFSVIVRDHRELAWKSMRHHDGTMYDGMFIVGIETPKGQATYHYDIDPYWDMFDCKELDRAPEWDGHSPADAIERIATLGRGTCHDKGGTDENGQQVFDCDVCGCVLSLYDRDGTNTLCTGFVYDYPRYCPVCGRKVVSQ